MINADKAVIVEEIIRLSALALRTSFREKKPKAPAEPAGTVEEKSLPTKDKLPMSSRLRKKHQSPTKQDERCAHPRR
jgi:hypothetical protein